MIPKKQKKSVTIEDRRQAALRFPANLRATCLLLSKYRVQIHQPLPTVTGPRHPRILLTDELGRHGQCCLRGLLQTQVSCLRPRTDLCCRQFRAVTSTNFSR